MESSAYIIRSSQDILLFTITRMTCKTNIDSESRRLSRSQKTESVGNTQSISKCKCLQEAFAVSQSETLAYSMLLVRMVEAICGVSMVEESAALIYIRRMYL